MLDDPGEYRPERVGELINRRQLAGGQLLNELATALDVGRVEAVALQHLLVEGGLTTAELAERVGLGVAGMSNLTARLERQGYVVRERDQRDHRCIMVLLTSAARAEISRRLAPVLSHHERLVARLGDEERGIVGAFLDRCLEITSRHVARLAGQWPEVSARAEGVKVWG